MRYFLVKYAKKASGQMDEIVSVSKKNQTARFTVISSDPGF